MRKEISLKTDRGEIGIYILATPEDLQNLRFDPQFREHTHYRSLYTRRQSLIIRAGEEDSNVVIALTEAGTIIAFGMVVYPDPAERWAHLKPKIMMEAKAIEVSRDWRSVGLGQAIARGMMAHPLVEEKIVYMVGYTWTWDLEASRMTPAQYKKMMIRLFSTVGLVEHPTNEPNICLDDDNLFMVRIGKNVPEKIRTDFKWLCFGQYE